MEEASKNNDKIDEESNSESSERKIEEKNEIIEPIIKKDSKFLNMMNKMKK